MDLKPINLGKPELKDDFPGKLNKWETIKDGHLRIIDSYPNFQNDLEQALDALEKNNSISKTICEKIRTDVKNKILKYQTYARFSKWCDWNQESSMILAKNISRILFGFDMPRILTQGNKLKDSGILNGFLSKLSEEKDSSGDEYISKTKEGKTVLMPEGKTMEEISEEYAKLSNEGRIEFITFHPSYSYEEFIEGITVEIEEENKPSEKVNYVLKPGIFKKLCKRALGAAIGLDSEETKSKSWREIYLEYRDQAPIDFDDAPKFVLIIDEINRGDIAKIFGELITLVEADKRIGANNELIATLPTSGDPFGVPKNLYIIATMNTADRSIALLDVALRRRFGFIEMNPDFDVLLEEHVEKNRDLLSSNGVYDLLSKSVVSAKKINEKICEDKSIGRDKQIGHSFLFKVFTINDLVIVWRYEIFPLLEEYCYSDYTKINRMLFGKDADTEWISESDGIKKIDKNNINKMLEEIIAE